MPGVTTYVPVVVSVAGDIVHPSVATRELPDVDMLSGAGAEIALPQRSVREPPDPDVAILKAALLGAAASGPKLPAHIAKYLVRPSAAIREEAMPLTAAIARGDEPVHRPILVCDLACHSKEKAFAIAATALGAELGMACNMARRACMGKPAGMCVALKNLRLYAFAVHPRRNLSSFIVRPKPTHSTVMPPDSTPTVHAVLASSSTRASIALSYYYAPRGAFITYLSDPCRSYGCIESFRAYMF